MSTIDDERLKQAMIEGYVNTRADRAELNRDWQIVDGEHWPAWDVEQPTSIPGGLLDPEDRATRRERQ